MRTHTYTNTHINTHTQTPRSYAHTSIHIHVEIHARTRTHKRTNTRTNTQTHRDIQKIKANEKLFYQTNIGELLRSRVSSRPSPALQSRHTGTAGWSNTNIARFQWTQYLRVWGIRHHITAAGSNVGASGQHAQGCCAGIISGNVCRCQLWAWCTLRQTNRQDEGTGIDDRRFNWWNHEIV